MHDKGLPGGRGPDPTLHTPLALPCRRPLHHPRLDLSRPQHPTTGARTARGIKPAKVGGTITISPPSTPLPSRAKQQWQTLLALELQDRQPALVLPPLHTQIRHRDRPPSSPQCQPPSPRGVNTPPSLVSPSFHSVRPGLFLLQPPGT
jgi:hypothetical protein